MSAVADASCCVETFNEKAQQQYRNEIKKKEEKKEVERMSLEKKARVAKDNTQQHRVLRAQIASSSSMCDKI